MGRSPTAETPMQQKTIIIYAVLLLPVVAFLVSKLAKMAEDSKNPITGRITDIASSTLSFMVAWAFLLAGQWEFAAAHNNHRPICARLEFAAVATFAAFAVIVVMGKILGDTTSSSGKAVGKLALCAVSTVVSWSWEQSFDKAVETLVDDNPQAKLEYKLGLALGMGVIVIPLYASYFHPAGLANNAD